MKSSERARRKRNKELALRKKIKMDHMEEQRDKYGYNFCMTCKRQPDIRGFALCHKVSLAQGGENSKENTYIGCGFCHNTDDHGIHEV